MYFRLLKEYKAGLLIATFRFPKDEELKKKWFADGLKFFLQNNPTLILIAD